MQSSTQNAMTLTPSAAASIAPTFRRFFAWWFGELGALFGRQGPGHAQGVGDAVIVAFAGDDVVVTRRTGRRTETIARMGAAADGGKLTRRVRRALAGKGPIVLRLAEADGLSRTVRLPAAAEADLASVIAFEIGRHTPFRADEVVHDHLMLRRDATAGRIEARLAVVPRRALDGRLAILAGWNVAPDALELPLADGEMATILLDRDARWAEERRARRRRNLVLGALVAVLAGVLVGIHLDRRAGIEADLVRRVEAAKAEAEAVAALRDDVVATYQNASALVRAKRRLPAAVVVLDELSRVLPDGTWLARLEIKDATVEVQGLAGAAAELIALIDDSDLLTDVEFRSPVTRSEDGLSESFHIGARLVEEVQP
jgi:general secretion pathway protein L